MKKIFNDSTHDSSQVSSNQKHFTSVDYLVLDEVRCDGGTKPRVSLDLKHVLLLESQIEDEQQLDPVIVFYDGESYWLADGFHRWHAHRNQAKEVIACVIYQGSRRDAVLYSVGANADHKPALPRSREDKRQAVMTLLNDPEWKEWSNYQIANACRVNEKTVRNIRSSLTTEIRSENSTRTYKTKYGTVAKMDTTKIGKPDLALLSGQFDKIVQFSTTETAIVKSSDPIFVAHHLQLVEGGLVKILAPNQSKINGRLGRIAAVHESTASVWLRDIDTMTMCKHTLKHQQLEVLPLDTEPTLVCVCDRLSKLRSYNLDPMEVEILLLLDRPVVFTPVELQYLAQIEQRLFSIN